MDMVITELILGPNGHDVSKFILETLFSLLESALVSIPIDKMVDSLISSAITSCYIESNEKLKASEIEHNYSGSTLVCAIIYKNTLYLSNVGDSRGIVVSKNKSRLITSLETIDHNPSIPSERQRIEASGGKVSPALDSNKQPFGPDRVWNQAMTEPGLAMTRSMGDFTAESLGITSKPGIHPPNPRHPYKEIELQRQVHNACKRWCVGGPHQRWYY